MLAGGGLLVALALLGVFLLVKGGGEALQPAAATSSTNRAVPYTKVMEGATSKVEKRANYLITSAEGLTELWELLETEIEPPELDFTTQSVVAVFAGEKPTGSHGIEVSSISDGAKRQVSVVLTAPAEACVVTQALTQPYAVVVVPATTLPYTHRTTTRTIFCD